MMRQRPAKQIRSLMKRIGEFRVSNGEYTSLGADAHERITKLMSSLSLVEAMSAIFHLAKLPEVEFYGYKLNPDKSVTVSNGALASIISIVLSNSAKSKVNPELSTRLVGMDLLAPVLDSAVCHNDDTDYGPPEKTDDLHRALHSYVPTIYTQEKLSTPLRNLLTRAASWYSIIPSEEVATCTPPEALDQYVQKEYGTSLTELGGCIPFFWAASEARSLFLWRHTFSNISNWASSPHKRFLDKISTTINSFGDPWVKEPSVPDLLPLRIPRILETPSILMGQFEGEPYYALPFPRALFNHFEETFYWKCFDHFKKLEGRATNTFSNWFGKVFEQYIYKLLAAVGTKKFRDLRELERLSIPAPDAMENLGYLVTFFEFKARRIHRKHLLYWGRESEEQLLEFSAEIIDQLLRFATRWQQMKQHPLRDIFARKAKVQFVIVTPGVFPINPYLKNEKWFAAELEKIRELLGLRKTPTIIFVGPEDVEVISRKKRKGVALGPQFSRFRRKAKDPYLSFAQWCLRGGGRYGLQNPVITQVLDWTLDKTFSVLNFNRKPVAGGAYAPD